MTFLLFRRFRGGGGGEFVLYNSFGVAYNTIIGAISFAVSGIIVSIIYLYIK